MAGDGIFCDAQLLLDDVGLDGKVGELVTQTLVLYSQVLAFLFPCLDFLFKHYTAFD